MSFAATWTAAQLARATGRDRDFPPNTVELMAVSGPWGRTCESVGWVATLRQAALSENPGELFVAAQREALSEVRSVIKAAETSDIDQAPLAPIDTAGARHGGAGSIVQRPLHLFVADDICTDAGWVLDPDFVRTHLIPRYAKLAVEARKAAAKRGLDGEGFTVGFHSDGDISEIYPDLAAAGFDAVHLASVSYVSISRLAAAAKSAGLIAFGGVASETLAEGDLSDELCRMLARTARADGLVVADDGGITEAAELDVLTSAYVKVGLY